MKNKMFFITGILSYVVSVILIFFYLILEFSIISVTSPMDRLKVIFYIFLFMYLGCFLLYKENKCKTYKLGKFNLWIFFFLYLIMLLNMTLFDSYFGRVGENNYLLDYSNIDSRWNLFTNLIPFKTIINYFVALSNGNISISSFLYNIFGNLLAFMPLGLFIPRLISIIDKWFKYFILVSLFIVFIEVMQFVLGVGTLDIDDYILNIFGSMLFYFITRIKYIDKLIDRVLYLKN